MLHHGYELTYLHVISGVFKVFIFIDYTETMDDKLGWMEVLNATTESQAEPREKFEKRKKSVRQRLNRRVSLLGIRSEINRCSWFQQSQIQAELNYVQWNSTLRPPCKYDHCIILTTFLCSKRI